MLRDRVKSFLKKGNDKLSNRLGVLITSFLVMLIISGILCGFVEMWFGEGSYGAVAVSTVIQIALGMMVPAYLTAAYSTGRPLGFLHLNIPIKWRHVSGIVIVFVLGWFSYNWLISLNESLSTHNPGEASNILLSNNSLPGLVLNIFILGCLTGLGEELFFRGCLQTIIWDKAKRGWFAILLTAIVFTFFHFDISGIIPLMLQGIFYGYLVYATRTVWTAIFAHALNNSIATVKIWADHIFPDSAVVTFLDSDNPILTALSFIALSLFFILCRNCFFNRKIDLEL